MDMLNTQFPKIITRYLEVCHWHTKVRTVYSQLVCITLSALTQLKWFSISDNLVRVRWGNCKRNMKD